MRTKIYKLACLVLVCLSGFAVKAQQTNLPVQNNRWAIQPDGSILWTIDSRLPHNDHIEMSGEKVSLWVQYGIDAEGRSGITKTVIFPTFRTLPDDTYSHISYVFHDDELPRFYVDNRLLKIDGKPNDQSFAVKSISHKGIMRVNAVVGNQPSVKIERSLFPSVDKPMALEKFVFTNTSNKAVNISMEYLKREVRTDSAKSKSARHSVIMATAGDGTKLLQPGASASFAVYYLATDHPNNKIIVDANAEEMAREQRVNQISKPLTLITPDSILNTAFDFAKLRATESIFKTKAGYLHSPGGLDYYAAIWANDQAEYVSPFFAFSGDSIARLSAINCYHLFASYMNPEYKPIPSSIVAEGDAMWNGAGDRGDQDMIAYGASRFALANGNVDVARTLWPLITWCLEFSNRKLNEQGVVNSDSDELEGRFPSGKANLSTNSLYYDALNSAVMLGRQLHQSKAVTDKYQQQAIALKGNIEKYFGAKVEGFDTYKYYETNDVLRAWICLPLTVNIYTRSKGTIDALFSPNLWTADGLATQAGKDTFWDRSTLYALRGVLQAGETEKAMKFLEYYSRRRLLGEHVPYPVEAYPEGNQRHLSAESGLYCRIFTEGLFGIRPTGFNSFNCTPRLPKDWNQMSLNQVHAFGNIFDLHISRAKQGKISITVINGSRKKTYTINDGDTQSVSL
ncbi:hypothetical protein SAMN05216464_102414 [Mucilaginibacter pineti]|uniref:Alpha-L-rhamnosidase six-hairpin glycosidase domain-containing protein n=1 Tax=Mucilaginibacter pineti TaxID=1391627 RepID=A0A1G6X8H3_9SPHI|nr:hypothetical protein [Mucilaginibacter pineti]SDD73597.1 hypothetical protein SAMN05216464_102414 [Mucilaginibacter pineti]